MDGPDYRRGQGGLSEQSSATPDPGWVTFDRSPAPGRVMGRRVPVRDGAADEQRAVRMLRTIEGYLISTALRVAGGAPPHRDAPTAEVRVVAEPAAGAPPPPWGRKSGASRSCVDRSRVTGARNSRRWGPGGGEGLQRSLFRGKAALPAVGHAARPAESFNRFG